jgi:hypothetical protein
MTKKIKTLKISQAANSPLGLAQCRQTAYTLLPR